jgi:hypothetical protein
VESAFNASCCNNTADAHAVVVTECGTNQAIVLGKLHLTNEQHEFLGIISPKNAWSKRA